MEAGDEILKMKGEASDLLLVQMVSSKSVTVYTDDIAEAGEPVSITSGDTTYTEPVWDLQQAAIIWMRAVFISMKMVLIIPFRQPPGMIHRHFMYG